MAGSGAMIDEIVAGVMARLRSSSAPFAPAHSPAPLPSKSVAVSPVATAPAATSPVELHAPKSIPLDDAVITAALLADRARGAGEVVATERAIVTPGARDWLKLNRVSLIRGARSGASAEASSAGWQILISTSTPTIDSLKSTITASAARPAWNVSGSVDEAVHQAIESITRATHAGVVIVTKSPDRAACLANRQVRVRAARVATTVEWDRAAAELAPNVACVSPESRTFLELRQLMLQIIKSRPATNIQVS